MAREAVKKILKNDTWRVTLDPEQLTRSLPHIPTGSLVIDYLIGGEANSFGVAPCPGLPRGRITQLWGHESAGKTTLALTAAATVCNAGGTVLYVDWENDIVPDYAAALGVPIDDPERFELVQPDSLEDGMKIIKAYVLAGVDLVVIDSVGAAVPQAIRDRGADEAGEQQRVGLNAQRWSEFLPDIKADIAKHKNALLGISQIRQKMASGPKMGNGPSTQPQGGEAWKFYSALRLELRRIQNEMSNTVYNPLTHKKEGRVVGGIIKAKVVKCKLSKSQGREELFYIRWGEGIDDLRSVLEIACSHRIIVKQGSWFAYGEKKWQGMEQMRKFFQLNSPVFMDVVNQVRPHLTTKSTEPVDEVEDDEEDLSDVGGESSADLASFVSSETGGDTDIGFE